MDNFEKFHTIVGKNEYFSDIPEYFYDCEPYKDVIEKCCSITDGILNIKNISCEKNAKSFDFNVETNHGFNSINIEYTNDFIDTECLIKEMNRLLKEVGYNGGKYFCNFSSGAFFDFAIGFICQNQEYELARQEFIFRDDKWLEARGIVRVGIERWRLEQILKAKEAEKNRTFEEVELIETPTECFIKINFPNDVSNKKQVIENLVSLIKENFSQQIIDYQGRLTIVCLNEKITALEIEDYNQILLSRNPKPILRYGFLKIFSQEIHLAVEQSSHFIIDFEMIEGSYAMIYKRKEEK